MRLTFANVQQQRTMNECYTTCSGSSKLERLLVEPTLAIESSIRKLYKCQSYSHLSLQCWRIADFLRISSSVPATVPSNNMIPKEDDKNSFIPTPVSPLVTPCEELGEGRGCQCTQVIFSKQYGIYYKMTDP